MQRRTFCTNILPYIFTQSCFSAPKVVTGFMGLLMSSLSFIYAVHDVRGQSIREMNLFCYVCESRTRFADLLAACLNVCVKRCSAREIVDLGRILWYGKLRLASSPRVLRYVNGRAYILFIVFT